ncbi:ComEC/Rec2 family competence protein [Clostridium sp. ZS6]|uniref:ComEC/Rec2 family competence protein n=1 Tax=Clostridium sp. ZS6 TaxID=2949987 RepID=UPI002079EC58|nr:ComEC/Rec2 family competence protein [Clostridium sp. ZS6]
MKQFKKLTSALLALSLFLFVLGCSQSTKASANNINETNQSNLLDMQIHYIDVGQGDSELIQIGDKNILIDAGCNDSKALNYLKSSGINKLDYIIVTHPHEDHIGGMATIINTFDIGEFYAPKVTHTTRTFENMVKALQNKGVKIIAPKVGDTLTIGNATMQFLAPNSDKYEELNNYSIVTRLKYGNKAFIFTGDAESLSEGEILSKQLDIQADVLKLGHHGSYSSTSNEFLNKVNPKYAIVSCGKNNDYGHPHKQTTDKLNKKGIEIFRTDTNGTIIATCDGNNISFITNQIGNNLNTIPNTGKNNNSDDNIENNGIWIANKTSKVYHISKECSNMKTPTEMSLEDAQAKGLKPCSKCSK